MCLAAVGGVGGFFFFLSLSSFFFLPPFSHWQNPQPLKDLWSRRRPIAQSNRLSQSDKQRSVPFNKVTFVMLDLRGPHICITPGLDMSPFYHTGIRLSLGFILLLFLDSQIVYISRTMWHFYENLFFFYMISFLIADYCLDILRITANLREKIAKRPRDSS